MYQKSIYVKVSDLENLLQELKKENCAVAKLCISDSEIPHTRNRLDVTAIQSGNQYSTYEYEVIKGIDGFLF